MTLTLISMVALGGLIGAPSRYLVDRAIRGRIESDRPWGTFAVNVSGALVFGVLTGLALGHHISPLVEDLLGTGFCGAYTTFSTFSFDTVTLLENGRILEASANVAASLVAGLAGAAAGVALGLAL